MSTLKTNNIEHIDASTPSVQMSVGGGVVFPGISTFTGNATFSAGVSIGGTLTYDDVTSIDSVGIITAQSNIHVFGDLDVASDIRHIGDTDTRLRFETDTISARTAGSERLRIDSSGRLLVAASSSTANSNADDLQIGTRTDSAERGITVASSVAGSIRFADDGNDTAGYIFYSHSDNSLRVGANGAERLRIDSSGRVLIGDTSTNYSNIKLLVAGTAGTNYISMLNTTATDSDEARFSYLHFRGTQSGGEVSSLASISAQHDGSSDDQVN